MNNNKIFCANTADCTSKCEEECLIDTSCRKMPGAFPPQHQNRQPGLEYIMEPLPASECDKPCRKLERKVALITGVTAVSDAL